jgi:hypothetical protein
MSDPSKSDPSKAVQTARLPQYQASPAFMERFLDAAHHEGTEIERSASTKGIKLVDGSEISADALNYFADNKTSMEGEFLSDLTEKLGATRANWFCDVIAHDWYDGRGLRNGARVVDLKMSVRQSLELILPSGTPLSAVVEKHTLANTSTTLAVADIQKILAVNRRMMVRHIEAWKEGRPDSDSISDHDIFFRRGLSLESPLDTTVPYKEWDYINSYSLAFSAPEKFAQMQKGKIPAIVNADLHLFDGRVLFFSPFVPDMAVGQLEAGIIPSEFAQPIRAQGNHGGIDEYIIGSRPD